MHTHHIMPRHLGGNNKTDNLVKVSVEEHAKIHHSLWVLGGRQEDYIAWKALTKQIDKEEIHRLASILGGSNGKGKPKNNVKPRQRNKQGPRTAEAKLRMSIAKKGRSGPKHSEEAKQKMRKPKPNRENYKGFIGQHSNETKQKIKDKRAQQVMPKWTMERRMKYTQTITERRANG